MLSDYFLHVLLAPHLGNQGGGNTAWVEDIEGTPLLLAQRDGCALALACSVPWIKRSLGYVGSSGGWQDLKTHKQMTWEYTRAESGNVALMGQIDLIRAQGVLLLALGFGKDPQSAARNAIGSLRDGFAKARQDYIGGWQDWIKTHSQPSKTAVGRGDLYQTSLAVLRAHESEVAPGGSSRASPSPGDSARATRIWGATTSCGRATW